MQEPVYRDRVDYYRYLGQREGKRIMLRRMVAIVIVLGLVLGGVGLVASRGAQVAPASGGGRVMVMPSPLEKWVAQYAQTHTKGAIKAKNVVVECRGSKCAAYNKPGTPKLWMVVVAMANGQFHLLGLIGPSAMGMA